MKGFPRGKTGKYMKLRWRNGKGQSRLRPAELTHQLKALRERMVEKGKDQGMEKRDTAARGEDLRLSRVWDPQKAKYRRSWTCRSRFLLTVPQPAFPKREVPVPKRCQR